MHIEVTYTSDWGYLFFKTAFELVAFHRPVY